MEIIITSYGAKMWAVGAKSRNCFEPRTGTNGWQIWVIRGLLYTHNRPGLKLPEVSCVLWLISRHASQGSLWQSEPTSSAFLIPDDAVSRIMTHVVLIPGDWLPGFEQKKKKRRTCGCLFNSQHRHAALTPADLQPCLALPVGFKHRRPWLHINLRWRQPPTID